MAARFHIQDLCIEINRLGNRIDRKYRDAPGKPVNTPGNDPVMIIKWKFICELLKDASGRAGDVADVPEGIVLKHGRYPGSERLLPCRTLPFALS